MAPESVRTQLAAIGIDITKGGTYLGLGTEAQIIAAFNQPERPYVFRMPSGWLPDYFPPCAVRPQAGDTFRTRTTGRRGFDFTGN